MRREQLKGHLDLLLLGVVSHGPAHGYQVITSLRERSDGAFDLPEGTIYPALHRREGLGLLTRRWSDASGRRRRVYELSGRGAEALAARRQEWDAFALAVGAVLA
jgi:DNA-binding PadR family transcriptional regulator